MEWLLPDDWSTVFIPDTPVLEIVARGSIIYLALFCMLRLVLKRQSGKISITDLLLLVLIADAAQNGMAANYHSIPDGLILIGTLVFWNYALDWGAFHSHFLETWVHPPPLILIRNGRLVQKNMKQELISKEELMSHLREQGIEKISQVKEACLEGNGKISIIKKVPQP